MVVHKRKMTRRRIAVCNAAGESWSAPEERQCFQMAGAKLQQQFRRLTQIQAHS